MSQEERNKRITDALPLIYGVSASLWRDVYDLLREQREARRMLDLLLAKGSELYPSKLNRGQVVVVDGRTGLDACSKTAEDAIHTLLSEIDGEGSPIRVSFEIEKNGLPKLAMQKPVPVEAIREAIQAAEGVR